MRKGVGHPLRRWPRLPGRACAAAILVVLCATGPAPASPGDLHRVRGAGASLRAAPGADAAMLRHLDPDTRLIEFDRRGAWVHVGVLGTVAPRGWVAARELDRLSRPTFGPAPAPAAPGEAPPRFVVTVSGTPGMRFAGDCILVDDRGRDTRRTFAGMVPERRAFEAAALNCLVRKHDVFGRLRVALRADGTLVVRAETAAPFNHVRVRSAGPWGAAGAVRGAIPSGGLSVPPRRPPGAMPRPLRLSPPPLGASRRLPARIVPPLGGSGAGVRSPG